MRRLRLTRGAQRGVRERAVEQPARAPRASSASPQPHARAASSRLPPTGAISTIATCAPGADVVDGGGERLDEQRPALKTLPISPTRERVAPLSAEPPSSRGDADGDLSSRAARRRAGRARARRRRPARPACTSRPRTRRSRPWSAAWSRRARRPPRRWARRRTPRRRRSARSAGPSRRGRAARRGSTRRRASSRCPRRRAGAPTRRRARRGRRGPTPKTFEPVPEIAPMPGCAPVAAAHAPTTSLTTIQSSLHGAHLPHDRVGVGAGDGEHGRGELPGADAGPLASPPRRRRAARPRPRATPTASSLLGPACARWIARCSRSSTAASVFVAPPSMPSR